MDTPELPPIDALPEGTLIYKGPPAPQGKVVALTAAIWHDQDPRWLRGRAMLTHADLTETPVLWKSRSLAMAWEFVGLMLRNYPDLNSIRVNYLRTARPNGPTGLEGGDAFGNGN